MTRASQVSMLLPLWLLFGCGNYDALKCGLFTGLPTPTCPTDTPIPKTCSELTASAFSWSLRGFDSRDILNPDDRNQTTLTAILHVMQEKTLRVSAGGSPTGEDCSAKATSVRWTVTDPAVVRLEMGADARTATLVGLAPGDTSIFADLQFQDGTPPLRAVPYSFTNVGSGNVTVVRVVP